MCLNPNYITPKRKYFKLGDYQSYNMYVPCMKCAECKQMMRNEWYLRNYWQSRYTFDNNGYVLFDTLTYRDEDVPHLSDFIKLEGKVLDYMCFNYEDVQDFKKRLKTNLDRQGYDSEQVKFFCASEYGTDPNRTHRPHYHFLLYVTDSRLSPVVLSQLIHDSWTHGRTDGVVEYGQGYVYHNTFGPRYIKDSKRLQGVVGYVCKYVTKDSEYQKVIDMRVHEVVEKILKKRYSNDKKGFLDSKRELKRRVDQFHKQSVGFGEYAISQANPEFSKNMETIWKDGTLQVPDSKKIVKSIPLPMYYARKLFYDLVRDPKDNGLMWILNDDGKQWKKQRTYANCVKVADRFTSWYNSLNTYVEDPEQTKKKIDSLLKGRTFMDFATYLVFYRGRLMDCNEDAIPSPDEALDRFVNASPLDGDGKLKRVDDGFIAVANDGSVYSVEYEALERYSVFCEDTDFRFRDFDRLYNYWFATMKEYNKKKQAAFDEKEALAKRLKNKGINTKNK